jgi:hypothetical protein
VSHNKTLTSLVRAEFAEERAELFRDFKRATESAISSNEHAAQHYLRMMVRLSFNKQLTKWRLMARLRKLSPDSDSTIAPTLPLSVGMPGDERVATLKAQNGELAMQHKVRA